MLKLNCSKEMDLAEMEELMRRRNAEVFDLEQRGVVVFGMVSERFRCPHVYTKQAHIIPANTWEEDLWPAIMRCLSGFSKDLAAADINEEDVAKQVGLKRWRIAERTAYTYSIHRYPTHGWRVSETHWDGRGFYASIHDTTEFPYSAAESKIRDFLITFMKKNRV